MRDPSPTLADCLLGCGTSHCWHIAAQLSQLSNPWRVAISSWREGQTTISITSATSAGEWLDAWDRPLLDATAIRALVREVPWCTTLQLMWFALDVEGWRQIARFSNLVTLLLETCAERGPHAELLASSVVPLCARLEKLSLWVYRRISLIPLLCECHKLRSITLNLQAFTQVSLGRPGRRVKIDATIVVACLATIPTLEQVALYEMDTPDHEALAVELGSLVRTCALTSFKVAECLALHEGVLGTFSLCPSLVAIEWGARSSFASIGKVVRGCAALRELILDDSSFPIDGASALEIAAHCSSLETLGLANNSNLSDDIILALCGRHPTHDYPGCLRLLKLDLSISDDDDHEHQEVASGWTASSAGWPTSHQSSFSLSPNASPSPTLEHSHPHAYPGITQAHGSQYRLLVRRNCLAAAQLAWPARSCWHHAPARPRSPGGATERGHRVCSLNP